MLVFLFLTLCLQKDKAGLEVALIAAQNEIERERAHCNQLDLQAQRYIAKSTKLKDDMKALEVRIDCVCDCMYICMLF